MHEKRDLPSKIFFCRARRGAWARVWDEVKYCSDACRMRKKTAQKQTL
ncbi:MAG: DUF2256 domain-containing protein [Acidobacteria bacterium]|nr:DUF2256 domain-containing protein [Acidobacteriota bacterium]